MSEKKGTKLIVEYDIHETSTYCKTGWCASLENDNEDCDEFEFQIVMVLQDSLSHSLVLLTLEALKCLFFPHPMIHLGLCQLIL